MNDFSIELLFSVWIICQTSQNIEDSFTTHKSLFPPLNRHQQFLLDMSLNKLKTADFVYYVFQICCSIIAIVSYGFYRMNLKVVFLTPVLKDILLYIWCRTFPDFDVNIFGIMLIRRVYLPYLTSAFNLFLTREFLSELQAIIFGEYHRIYMLFTHEYFWVIYISYAIGHFWWFVREFAIDGLYNTKDTVQRSVRQKTLQDYGVPTSSFIRKVFVVIVLPPWYWMILHDLKGIPDDEDQVLEEEANTGNVEANGEENGDGTQIDQIANWNETGVQELGNHQEHGAVHEEEIEDI